MSTENSHIVTVLFCHVVEDICHANKYQESKCCPFLTCVFDKNVHVHLSVAFYFCIVFGKES